MHKYEDVRCIGRGSYGSAHLVIERTTSQRFVIKKIPMELLNDTEKAQSFREVELLSKLKHPNVVEYKESFVENNVINIVMAYCDGGDLAGRIKERAAILANGGHGYFDTRQILDWFVQMAMAIKYLHEQRILHRDLKTNNIFLTTENVIKLGDFGIAKTLDSTLDQAKTVVGTPYYMSPEVCESKPYSYASDVWSLGCVLYEIVALKHAFDAPNILMLVLKIVQKDFASVPAHYDPEISDILKRLLDKSPEKRPTMDQIFLMPYIRNHMQALAESGGSLKMSAVARRPNGTPRRRVTSKNGRRASTDSSKAMRRGVPITSAASSSSQSRWAAVAPNDREEVLMGDGSDLELLDASVGLDDSSSDLRLPERSKTPEPLVVTSPGDGHRSPPPPPPPQQVFHAQKPPSGVRPSPMRRKNTPNRGSWVEGQPTTGARRPSAEEVEEELDTRFQTEAAEALMNPNFQRVYAEECDDSLTVKYASHSKARARQPRSNGRPPKPESATPAYTIRRRVGGEMVSATRSEAHVQTHDHHQQHLQTQWGVAPRRGGGRANAVPLTLSLSLDESTVYDSEHMEASTDGVNLSDSGMLRQLELEEASSGDEDDDEDAYTSNSDEYDGEENFYSEHSAYSDDSDFAGEENETEYSDDFEELDGEVIDYANDEFTAEDDVASENASGVTVATTGTINHPGGIKSPKLVSSPASRRPPREVQWVMRNVAQSLMESCDNLSVA